MWQCSLPAVAQIMRIGFSGKRPTQDFFFDLLFEKYYYHNHIVKSPIDNSVASRLLSGGRTVTKNMTDYYSGATGLAYLKDTIEKTIIPELSDPARTTGQIYDLVKGDITISKEKKKELSASYSTKNDADMANYMATILQFAMNRNDISNDNQSELKVQILNASIPTPCQHFLGRKDELTALREILKNSKNVFIEGIGGIGKSEFVKAYIKRYRKDFTDVLYFVYSGSLKKTIASMEVDGEKSRLNEVEKFNRHLTILRKLSKNACLVIDNFDVSYTKDKNLQAILGLSCHVLFTTRSQFDSIQNETVFLLNEITNTEELLELMANYYPDASSNRDTMMGIIDVVHSHTLSVELAARLLNTGILTPSELLSKLQNENVALDNSDEIVLTKDGKPRKATYQKHIHLLFALFQLSDRQKSIMCCMAFIPLSGVPATLFSRFIGKDNNNNVNALVERGLIRRGNEQLISLHPLIMEVVLADLHPSITSCKTFLKRIQSTILKEGIIFSEYNTLIPIIDSIIDKIRNDDSSFYLRFLEDLFNFMEEYDQISSMNRIVSEMSALLDDPSSGTIIDMMHLYDYRARLESDPAEALKLREKALPLAKKVDTKDPSSVLFVLNFYANLGASYYAVDRFDEAYKCMDFALSARKILHLPFDKSELSLRLNYGILLFDTGKQDEGIKQIEVVEEVLRKNYPRTAFHAEILYTLGMYLTDWYPNSERGEKCLLEALSIYKIVYQDLPKVYSEKRKLIQNLLLRCGTTLPSEFNVF